MDSIEVHTGFPPDSEVWTELEALSNLTEYLKIKQAELEELHQKLWLNKEAKCLKDIPTSAKPSMAANVTTTEAEAVRLSRASFARNRIDGCTLDPAEEFVKHGEGAEKPPTRWQRFKGN